ncbi:hypothetical protein B5G06_08210 [Flavonifractor sp. An52]|uniref:M56 family metallopeptidase n=1 Tax=Flavonifractor sp. An52 TaxID=1965642 RepID=UPI000B3A10F1|nr:M56 family metallopeptidase [Flavonifractor sp. An52]OUN83139.1 hypothetical protein B5G06_08210 [Flavonifractor sp. An52]
MTQLLQMTVQGTLLIAVLLLLRALFRRRISPVILYALWLLPAARLLIPGSVESAFSLQNFVPASAGQGMATVLGQGSAQVPQLSQAQTTAPPAAADLAQQAAIPSGAALDVGTLLTVSMYYDGGQEDTLSCVFVTGDGRTWAAITSGGPLQPDRSQT